MNMFSLDWNKVANNAKSNKEIKPSTVVDIQHVLNQSLQNRQIQNPGNPIIMPNQGGFSRTN